MDEDLYQRLRCSGTLPAILYGLAKVHKGNNPLRPVLSLPGSAYERPNKWLAKLFDKVPGANFETSTSKIAETLGSIHMDIDETIFSMDVKSLCINVPVGEAMDLP